MEVLKEEKKMGQKEKENRKEGKELDNPFQ